MILYNNRQWPAQWLDQEAAPKHSLKPNLHQGKVRRHWSAASLIHYSFLNSGKTIPSEKHAQQINEMLCKLQRLQPALVNRKGPILLHKDVWLPIARPTLQKLNKLGYEVLTQLSYSPDLSPTNLPLLQTSQQLLAGKTLPQPAGSRKCFPRVSQIILKHEFLCYSNKHTYFSTAKMCWL